MRKLGLSLVAALASAPLLAGCMEYDPGLAGEIQLGTHVSDWHDEVIYQLLVDRFGNGDAGNDFNVNLAAPGKWHGGDWKGVEDHLDYLSDLGVTTLWISPVVKNVETDAGFDGYHGYWTQDFTQPNPHFGDVPALRHMVAAAHDKGMKVILDIVTNHVGQLFYYDINENGQPDENVQGGHCPSDHYEKVTVCKDSSTVQHVSEYDPDFDTRGVQAYTSLGESGPAPIIFQYDPATNHMPPMPEVFQNKDVYNKRGRTLDFDVPDQLIHGDFPGGLKDVNTTRCDVKQAMVDVYARWVELADLDGFRIDTVKHVEREFWRYFTQKVRQRLAPQGKHDFLMFGEAFDGNDQLVGSFTKNDLPSADDLARENRCVTDGIPIKTGDQLDGVFYFPQYYSVIRDVFQSGNATQAIQDLWAQRATNYGSEPPRNGAGMSPQTAVVNFLDNHDVGRFLFSGQGVAALQNALLFIFTEQGIPCVYYGTEQELSGGNDPANREDLWDTGYDETKSTFLWIQRLSRVRRGYRALSHGDQKVVWASARKADETDAGIFAFERTGGEAGPAYALVVLNTSPTHASKTEFQGAKMKVSAAGKELVDVLGHGSYTVGGDGTLSVEVPARRGLVLVPKDQVQAGL
jgi:glycosidase